MAEHNKNKALIIGISDYDNLKKLEFCKNDGEDIFTVLSELGYDIVPDYKLVGRVEFELMKKALINFFKGSTTSPKDTLLFYFSGHGVLDEDGNSYFAASDIDPSLPFDKGISFDLLKTLLRVSRSNKIVTILDCCYSGSATLGKEGNEEDTATLGKKEIERKMPQGEGRYLLASSRGYQKSFPMPDKKYSVFTNFILDGLRGRKESVDNNGFVTPDTLGKYVDNRISELPEQDQKPIRKVEASGDIVLAYYPELIAREEYLLKLLLDGEIKKFNNIREKCGYTVLNLDGVDLNGRNLSGVDFRSASLVSANLQATNMQKANLQNTNLTSALIEGADLSSCMLTGATLRSTIIKSSKLLGANLENASLQEANLVSVDLEGSNLTSANLFRALVISANLTSANLSFANLNGADLEGANLTSANLTSANLSFANLVQSNLQKANLKATKFFRANIEGANLSDSNIKEAAIFDNIGLPKNFIDNSASLK